MRNTKAVLEYWQLADQYLRLMDFNPRLVSNKWQNITRDECLAGCIQDPTVSSILLQNGSKMLVSPLHLQKDNEHFIPFLLSVELKADGYFKPCKELALPIIPRNLLEFDGLHPISLGSTDEFDDYFVLQPPPWFDNQQDLTWENQYQYANQMLSDITCGAWLQDLKQLGYELQPGAKVFAFSINKASDKLDTKLLQNKNKIELIAAERNSGKSRYAKQKIADAWIEAAVKQAPAPKIVWLQYDTIARYTSIFACTNELPLYIEQDEYKTSQSQVHKELALAFNIYIRGRQVLRNWQDMQAKLTDKYADKGGIAARIHQLQTHLKEAQARSKHIQVLHSIYLRQSELIPSWNKMFDVFTFMQKQRLQRLYNFFKQNFPEEQVTSLSQDDLDNLMNSKLSRTKHSERFIADALHQATSDLKQQELVTEKLLQWGQQIDPKLETPQEIVTLLHETIWEQVLHLATKYWQLEFAINGQRNEFFTNEADTIDLLIAEHSEYIDPITAAKLLARSQRAIIMGQYAAICSPRFAISVDYELCKHFNLAKCDADYEDLQFEGINAALGNLWNLASDGREADKTFTTEQNYPIEYEFCSINGTNVAVYGSKVNIAEIDGIHAWLLRNNPDPKDVCIYTSFAGQVQAIQQRLQSSKYAQTAVQLLHKPNLHKFKYSLFTSVYTANDPGPYNFDRGVEILDNLVANTLQKLVVFGDRNIFKSELHSAIGKFAKLFITEKNQQYEAELNV